MAFGSDVGGTPSAAQQVATVGAGILNGAGLAQATAQVQASGGYSSSSDRPVWWGSMAGGVVATPSQGGVAPEGRLPGWLEFPAGEDVRLESDSVAWLDRMMLTDTAMYLKVRQGLIDAGLIDDSANSMDVLSAWGHVVSRAAGLFNANDQTRISPLELLDQMVGSAAASGTGGSRSYTQRSYSVSTPGEIGANYSEVAQPLIGRNPTGLGPVAEIQAAQRANPTVTTTTVDAQGNQTSTTQGGYSSAEAARVLRNAAMSEPDYGSYQAATTYWNALHNDIISPAANVG